MNPTAAFNAGVPALGTWILYAFVVAAAVAFGIALVAATSDRANSGRYLRAARLAALGTCALIAFDVLLLLYEFTSHDFRVRYVMRYSDRSMPIGYLVTALWGGQDGSLLWWAFLLSLYTSACVLWLKGRHRELAPYVIATLMGIIMFFGVLMAFAANPFSANVAGAPPDGEGLNPALQNFYMAIHPPSLYTGFVGCAIPFAFAVAALLSGKLDEEWIYAVRRWTLVAWFFLSIGNVLGMLWAYEELGWGGFWAWDPVENAACMPWWTCTAFLHSSMIQERRQSLKVWNVSLVLLTFLLTIFGTFLTRSGLISSVHSFAQSEVGIYFVYFMAFLVAVSVALVLYRLPKLRSEMWIDSMLSREAMFIANNWLLLGACAFIVVATTWPKIAEWAWNERITVGASFYNFWLPIPAVVLLGLMAIGTLTPWRKGSGELLWRAFRGPIAAGIVVAILHVMFGRRFGFAPYSRVEPIYPSGAARLVAQIDSSLPPVFWAMVTVNISAVVQEFFRGTMARMRTKSESALPALGRLMVRNRRRYGGYIVHVGFSLMVLGWIGPYWRLESEASLRPGETFSVGPYDLQYDGVQTHRDPNKREIVADITVHRGQRLLGQVHPARFIYTTHPEMPTSEVSISTRPLDDLYVVLASVNPSTHVAHLKAWQNPFTAWIWFGALILLIGTSFAVWPEVSLEFLRRTSGPDATAGGDGEGSGGASGEGGGGGEPLPPREIGLARTGQGTLVLIILATVTALFAYSSRAHAQGHGMTQSSSGEQTMTPEERRLFDRMLCMCGDCQRLPLATCTCDFAATMRGNMRERLAAGMPADEIVRRYVERFGQGALSVPPDAGHNRAVYALPMGVAVAGGALAIFIVKRWSSNRPARPARPAGDAEPAGKPVSTAARDEYERRLDEELRGLDD